jgi:hypothetical protein
VITLQDLIDLARNSGLDPARCVLVYREECSIGPPQMDYLIAPQVVTDIECVSEDEELDEHEPVATAIAMCRVLC